MIFWRNRLGSTTTRLLFLRTLSQVKAPRSSLCSESNHDVDHIKCETILAQKNKDSFLTKFKSFETMTSPQELSGNGKEAGSKTRHKRKKDDDNKVAAVLVPLCTYKGKLGLLYTLRSQRVSLNRGQVSFPGGMKDEADRCLEETALRETWEELRIPKHQIEVWGCGNLVERRHVSVMPVVAYLGEVKPDQLDLNKEEVEEAFVLQLQNLCDPNHCRFTQFRNKMTLPVYTGGTHRIWGLTAIITHITLSSLLPKTLYGHSFTYIEPVMLAR